MSSSFGILVTYILFCYAFSGQNKTKSNEIKSNENEEDNHMYDAKETLTLTQEELKELIEAQQDYPELARYPMALKVSDVAEILNVGRSSVDELVHSNRIRYVRVGKLIRIPRDAVYEFLHDLGA